MLVISMELFATGLDRNVQGGVFEFNCSTCINTLPFARPVLFKHGTESICDNSIKMDF